MRILIICTGNSCRSQMAEAFLKSYDQSLEVFSAGTRIEKNVNPIAVEVMAEAGIDISNQKPKLVNDFLNDYFDFVITVCDSANRMCPVFTGKVEKRMHISFKDPSYAKGSKEEIISEFRNVRDQINEKFLKFYKSLKNGKSS